MSDLIKEIKSRLSCIDIFRRHYPTNYREHGNCICPFHDDSPAKPSMKVSRDKAHCFGACGGKSFDQIDLTEKALGISKKEAIERLAKEAGLDLKDHGPRKPAAEKGKTRGNAVPKDFLPLWKTLRETELSDKAVAYFEKKRGLVNLLPELNAKGLIGFNPKWRQYSNDPDTGELTYETKPALAFPVSSWDRNNLLGIQFIPLDGTGKKFAKDSEPREGFFHYGNGSTCIVVCEAVIDALSVYIACRKQLDLEVVSLYSASTYEKVKNLPGTPVLFLDDDLAGIKATIRILGMLRGGVRIVDWSRAPKGCKDVNDLLRGNHGDVIEQMVKGSKHPSKEEIPNVIAGLLCRMEEKAKTPKQREDFERFVREIPPDGECKKEKSEIDKRIDELNQSYAVIMVGGKCLILNEFDCPIFHRKDINFSSIYDFKSFHANEKYPVVGDSGRSKMKDIGTLWFESENRRQYKGIVFDPGANHNDNGFFNLFRGFATEPRQGDWTAFQDHILTVIANRNAEVFTYILAWLAHLFQYPGGERPGTSIVLRGEQGTGKGCFVSQIGKMLGTHYLPISNSTQLVGRFNNHLKDALLVFCDEGIWAGDKSAEGVLKAMVTEELLTIEPKGKDPFPVKNRVRLIVASNNDWVIPAGLKERRFCVLDVSESRIQDKEYFQKVVDQMDHGGREAMLYDLLHLDISAFDLKTFPQTQALMDQKIRTMKTAHKFWFERLRAGSLTDDTDEWDKIIPTQKLHEAYVQFATTAGDRYPSIDSLFLRELKEVAPNIYRHHPFMDYKGKYQRVWSLTFPDLDKCREYFDKIMKTKTNWEDRSD